MHAGERELTADEARDALSAAFREATDRIYGNELVERILQRVESSAQFGLHGGAVMRRAIAQLENAAGEFGLRAAAHARLGIVSLAVADARLAWACALASRGWREL